MSKCTWKECTSAATKSQVDKYGHEWANLCDLHAQELEQAVSSLNPRQLLSAWAKAGKEHSQREKTIENMAKTSGKLFEFLKGIQKEK